MFEGGHSDHDSVAFAVHAAHRLANAPADLFEMPLYYGAETGWVRQRFLPAPGCSSSEDCLPRTLSPADRALKARMMAAHVTQRDTLAAFSLNQELFRRAPAYDFALRPHNGPLLYERHGWNLTWDSWTDRVAVARSALGLKPA